jgi:hypothetical protein
MALHQKKSWERWDDKKAQNDEISWEISEKNKFYDYHN